MSEDNKKECWSYFGEYGPERWHELYPVAASGERQSPVAIDNATKISLPSLDLNYGEGVYNVERDDFSANIFVVKSSEESSPLSGRI
ncbi:MAG: hypothetical protein GY771_01820, partial [bacterium]|nr:hypothetical protein [bacterium]